MKVLRLPTVATAVVFGLVFTRTSTSRVSLSDFEQENLLSDGTVASSNLDRHLVEHGLFGEIEVAH